MKFCHILLLSCIGVVLSVIESQGLGFDFKDVYTCLEVQTKPVNPKILQSYEIKNIPIHAVLFSLKIGKNICADPKQAWVKKAIKALDKKAKTPSPETGASESKKSVQKPATKSKKPAAKKTKRNQKKKAQPTIKEVR
ncbi:eotaxin-like [Engystomops pustulosus]|uniref:eotaxin-like n=1 Tax=Engystomops pustulosus TaxID=76066 RepID=UPI003AFB65FF